MTHFKLRKMTSGTRQCLKFYHKTFTWMSYVNWFVKLCQINYMDAIKNSCNRSIKFGWLAYTGSVYQWYWYETRRLKKRVFSGFFSINFPWNCPTLLVYSVHIAQRHVAVTHTSIFRWNILMRNWEAALCKFSTAYLT